VIVRLGTTISLAPGTVESYVARVATVRDFILPASHGEFAPHPPRLPELTHSADSNDEHPYHAATCILYLRHITTPSSCHGHASDLTAAHICKIRPLHDLRLDMPRFWLPNPSLADRGPMVMR
jgi:hypothetical protein